jgi:hypothetical protein
MKSLLTKNNFLAQSKWAITIVLITLSHVFTYAQTDLKIGSNPGNKTSSAILELESTSKGFLLPRMNATQMGAIASPTNGLMVYNTDQQCAFVYRGSTWVSMCDSATNGLTKTGNVISLGGSLTQATTITTTSGNTLAIAGLQGGAATDSIMTLDATTGVLRRRTVADVLAGAGNVWLIGGNTLTANGTIGTNSAHDFTIETNGANRLTFTSAGAITQAAGGGQVTFTGNVDATSGLDVTGALLTANAGSTLTGATNINATGAGATNIGNATSTTTVLGATNINTTGTSATAIGNAGATVTVAGTTSVTGATTINTTGANNTSIGNATSTTSVTGATNINTTGTATTTIGNSGAVANIAGSTVGVTGATNINTTGTATTTIGNATSTTNIAGNTLNITNTPNVTTIGTNNVALVDATTGRVRNISAADLVGNTITADNGLTKNTATNVRLGGTLLTPTNIAQGGNTMTFTGGNFGVGAAAPNSTLQVTGSQSVSMTRVSASTTLDATHYIVLANANTAALTLTLPSAAANTGRTYYIGKTDESTNAVTFSPALRLTETTTVASINFAKKYKIVSDGTDWWIYNE